MDAGKNRNKFLVIALFSFLVIFTLGLIFVNNWLRETLKEEVASVKSESIPSAAKPKYKQAPIEIIEKSVPYPVAENKSAGSEKTAGSGRKEIEETPLPSGVLLN